jgi:hypothetical protein
MEQITLIDCNHLQSADYRGGNVNNSNAHYTCKLGSGIKVKQGDKISIHQTFISEVGSDDNSIQITDKFIKKRNFTFTKQTPSDFVDFPDNDFMYGYKKITASNVTEEISIFENNAPILYNYYITNHGECGYSLPRRFVNASYNGSWNASRDTLANGKIYGNFALVTSLGNEFNYDYVSMFYCDDDMFWFQVSKSNSSTENFLKPIINNSRFTIFTQTKTKYGVVVDGANIVNGSLTSPAGLEYIEYIDKLDMKVSSGFRSAESIGDTITSQLRAQNQPKINKLHSNVNWNPSSVSLETYRPLNVEITSPTYKTFFAGSFLTNNSSTWNSWDNASKDSKEALQYLSSYQYIGIKRPVLFQRGRDFANFYKKILNDRIGDPNYAPNVLYGAFQLQYDLPTSKFTRDSDPTEERWQTIVTDILWSNKEAMKLLAQIFDEQGNHPELFLNKYNQYFNFTTINNSRFLHMNVLENSARNASHGTYKTQLGTDYMKSDLTGIPYYNSVPIFFDFNPEYQGKETQGSSWESGYSYGVFKRYDADNGLSFVSFTTSKLGFLDDDSLDDKFTTIPNLMFLLNDGTGTGNTIFRRTLMGWDCHFTSYGNVCQGLTSGWTRQGGSATYEGINVQLPSGYGNEELQSFKYQQQIYLGANEPLMEYNNTSNRFELSNLHTAERVQNRFNAGSTAGTEVEEFETAGDKVYKINKRLYNNSWNPDVIPYPANRRIMTVSGESYANDFLNPNLAPWTIFDQYSGIVIKDFGFDQETWTKGMWYSLGYNYENFNSPANASNDITTRVGNENKDNLPYAFTNAEVGQTSTMDFNTNIFGAGMYNLQLPSTQSWNEINSSPNYSVYFRDGLLYEQFPAITESATSIKLSAPRMPRKLESPYFCVRSNVLDDSLFVGGFDSGQLYPIIATIPKSNDYGDFFVSLDSSIEFTFSQEKTITEITTSIHNPDMTLAQVNDSSAVIYKLTRFLPENRFNVVQQIMEEDKK